MIDWRKVQDPRNGQPGRCEEVRRYALTPGIAPVYNEGDLHSPKRSGPTRLIRPRWIPTTVGATGAATR